MPEESAASCWPPSKLSKKTSVYGLMREDRGGPQEPGVPLEPEIASRLKLFRVVVRVDTESFFFVSGLFWRKTSGTSGDAHATPIEASLLAPPLITDTPNI